MLTGELSTIILYSFKTHLKRFDPEFQKDKYYAFLNQNLVKFFETSTCF